MIKQAIPFIHKIALFAGSLVIISVPAVLYSAEWLLDSDVSAEVGYNDNLFLVPDPQDGIATLKVTPRLRLLAREENWETALDARLRSNTYSDEVADSVDKYLDASGQYRSERNIFSLRGIYALVSNLNRESPDFGVTTQNVQTERIAFIPEYTRLLTERLTLSLSYNYTDVDFRNAEDTSYIPYITNTVTGSFYYSLTERDDLRLTLRATDYSSKNNTIEYQLYITSLGIKHRMMELWIVDFSVGGSRRNSTSRLTLEFDFLGQPVTINEEIDFSDDGYVLDAGVIRLLESGSAVATIGRDYVPNSQGGLNEVDRLVFSFNNKLSELWSYTLQAKYEDINAASAIQRSTDRETFFFDASVFYSITRQWKASAMYKYTARKFKGDTADTRAPHSNAVVIGISYNFPSLSSF